MKILVTGASGVLGSAAIPALLARGHQIHGAVRDRAGAATVATLGAHPIELDLFDAAAVRGAVTGMDAVVHLATAIPPLGRMHRQGAWRDNDRLREVATGSLVDGALGAGVETFVFPSITFNYADGGDRWLDEDAPIEPPFGPTRSALTAESQVQRLTAAGGRGIIIRLARLYGPGRASAEQIAQARARGGIIVGRGDNYVSNLHSDDAGRAVAAAVTVPPGVYNVADDRPVTARELAEAIARAHADRGPRQVPAPVARLLIGRATRLLTVSQRVATTRFRTVSGWRPEYPDALSWWEHRPAIEGGSSATSMGSDTSRSRRHLPTSSARDGGRLLRREANLEEPHA